MPTRLPSLRKPPLAFAHRGARAEAPENTLEAFRLALELGASGLESDVWLTRDLVPVLHHDGLVRTGVPRRRIGDLDRSALPGSVPALEDLYATLGGRFDLSLDLKDAAAAEPVIAVAEAAGDASIARLWLCHHEVDVLARIRPLSDAVHLVDSTRLRRLKEGPERRAATLADHGIEAVNLHHSDWNGGLTTLFHRFGVLAFGWDAQFERVLDELLDMGIDGVYSDHVDRMMTALERLSATDEEGGV
jgi:glycerophosphoryl diester phosphodiesterase